MVQGWLNGCFKKNMISTVELRNSLHLNTMRKRLQNSRGSNHSLQVFVSYTLAKILAT